MPQRYCGIIRKAIHYRGSQITMKSSTSCRLGLIRVMQLSWLIFVAYARWLSTEGVAKHSFLGCNLVHQSICTPQLQPCYLYVTFYLYVQLLYVHLPLVPNVLPWYWMYYPKGMKAQVSPVVQSIEPHRILAPTREPVTSGSTVVVVNTI